MIPVSERIKRLRNILSLNRSELDHLVESMPFNKEWTETVFKLLEQEEQILQAIKQLEEVG